jgi:hypothetical protein
MYSPCGPCDTNGPPGETAIYDGNYYTCPGQPYYKVTTVGYKGSGSQKAPNQTPFATSTNGRGCDCQCYGDDDCYCTCSYDDDAYGNNQIKYDITYGPGITGNPCQCSCQDDGSGYACSCDCQESSSGGSSKGSGAGVSSKGTVSKGTTGGSPYKSGFTTKGSGSGSLKYNDDYFSSSPGKGSASGKGGKTTASSGTDDYYNGGYTKGAVSKGAGGTSGGGKSSTSNAKSVGYSTSSKSDGC